MEVTEHQGKALTYLTVLPDSYDPGRQYPLVVLLHGFGANMRDLAGLCPAIDRQRYVYICPNGPIPVQVGLGMLGYAWTPPGESGTPEDAQRAEEMLATLVDEVMERRRVEPEQVILGGFSQGGMMTYRLGLPNPGMFRGLAVLSSKVPDPEALRLRLPTTRTQAIFIAHGTGDTMISVEDARESRRFLEAEGYRPEYREYSMGHEINQEVLSDLVPWIHSVLSTIPSEQER